jgi:hypothetical protein
LSASEQAELSLTAHPLQRVGAYVLAALAKSLDPDKVRAEVFQNVADLLCDDAIRAALVRDSKRDFWLKCSYSFFPNSKMNHLSNGKKDDDTVISAVTAWRTLPSPDTWPDVGCVLCGRSAVKFFGKTDVALAESDLYRNTTPRGHQGMALCWPCVVCFYALPYGCRLTGGTSAVLHSWDGDFLAATVARQVGVNRRIFELGGAEPVESLAREVIALKMLRHYPNPMRGGVELLAFSNNNRGQTLDIYAMDQPLAEWLRRTEQLPARRRGFQALLRAHKTADQPGVVGLARNAFREPARIVGACTRYLASAAERGAIPEWTGDLAALCFSFAIEVMRVNQKDLTEIRTTAARVASLFDTETRGGKLKEFHATLKAPTRMRSWLLRRGVEWALTGPKDADGPLVTTRGMELLFDPGPDVQAWFNRQMLLVAVLEQLHRTGWRPVDGEKVAEEMAEEPGDEDQQIVDSEET